MQKQPQTMTDEDVYFKVSATVKRLRTAKGLYQADLAKQLQLTQAQVSRLEAGVQHFNMPLVRRVSDVLGITFTEFIKEAEL